MISRYRTPEIDAVWSDVAKWSRYLEVELLATDAHAAHGLIPATDAATCRANAPTIDEDFVEALLAREAITHHDVAAFVDLVQSAIGGDAGKWIHYGLTSSDVGDTVICWQLRDAANIILAELDILITTLVEMARRHRATPMVGRTHGIHAEPTTFGAKIALWALQADRDRIRLRAARDTVSVMKMSGAVGTYSNISPVIERSVGDALSLAPVAASQIIARDRHAEFLYACASIGATCELIAVELRHLQRTEVSEVREGFSPGQKGSSAMPHKRNPISAETISGLARVLRTNALAGLQDIALWHERDISHSSVERIVLPDSAHLTHYVVRRLTGVLSRLVVDTERMAANLHSSHGLVFSQAVLLALVSEGMSRDEAYRIVQGHAMHAWDEKVSLEELLRDDPNISDDIVANAFDVERSLNQLEVIFDQLDAIDR